MSARPLAPRVGRLLRYVNRQGGYNDLSFRHAREYVRGVNQARRGTTGLWGSC